MIISEVDRVPGMVELEFQTFSLKELIDLYIWRFGSALSPPQSGEQ